MENKMFCFQCEQTAGCTGCTSKMGVCGKTAEVAELQDQLTGAIIGLAKTINNTPFQTDEMSKLIIEALFTTITNVNFNEETLKILINKVHNTKNRLINIKGNDIQNDYDMRQLWNDNEDIRSLKSLVLFGIRGMAAYAYHAMVLGYKDNELNAFFTKAL